MNHSLRRAAACLAAVFLLTGCQGAASSSASASSEAEINQEMPDYSLGLTDEGLFDGVDVTACVTLPDYQQVPSGEAFTTVSEEDLQAAIDQFMSSYAADTQITDRAVEDGDTVKVQVTFPDPYTPNTDLSGKQAEFDTTINYIHGEAQPPELTEDFVTNYLSYYYGYTSVEDMRQKISAQLLEEQKYNYVLDWLYDNCTFQPVPEQLVQDQLTILDTELANAANGYGITLDELAAKYGADSVDSLKEAYRPRLENMIRQNLMCQALAQDAGITVDQNAVDEYFAQQDVNDCTALMKSYGKGYISQGVRTELVAQYLMEHVAAE